MFVYFCWKTVAFSANTDEFFGSALCCVRCCQGPVRSSAVLCVGCGAAKSLVHSSAALCVGFGAAKGRCVLQQRSVLRAVLPRPGAFLSSALCWVRCCQVPGAFFSSTLCWVRCCQGPVRSSAALCVGCGAKGRCVLQQRSVLGAVLPRPWCVLQQRSVLGAVLPRPWCVLQQRSVLGAVLPRPGAFFSSALCWVRCCQDPVRSSAALCVGCGAKARCVLQQRSVLGAVPRPWCVLQQRSVLGAVPRSW
ncbi:hypothetical protein NDU88_000793 [Pleurodeles waltl]|uniref:Uncharacterized protein n=1 Tax=Pleurodeles waltl TaxID=8319 RepID=A0AAV7UV31_PLEWA|nr:hypothetical protein NDU88_000793 [Pleurodeles waltl]